MSNGSGGARSGTSATGGGKRIEPMFNLAVHNVMQPTVVTDAATDTKVAKVSPRVHVRVGGVLDFLTDLCSFTSARSTFQESVSLSLQKSGCLSLDPHL